MYDKLNKRPRKCLGYKTPYEVYYSTVLQLTWQFGSENLNAPFLDISSIGEFYLSDKAMQNFDSIRDMEDYVEKRLDFLVDKVQMDAYLSQLIANVTGSFGNAPVVILSE